MQIFNLRSGRDAIIDNSGASSSVFWLFFDELFNVVPSLIWWRFDGVDFTLCFPSSEGSQTNSQSVSCFIGFNKWHNLILPGYVYLVHHCLVNYWLEATRSHQALPPLTGTSTLVNTQQGLADVVEFIHFHIGDEVETWKVECWRFRHQKSPEPEGVRLVAL